MRFKLYHLLLFIIPFILIYVFRFSNSALDIQVHDTYIVIAYTHIGIVSSFLLALLAMVYYFFEKKKIKLNKWLTATHVFVTLLFFFLLLTNFFMPRPTPFAENQKEVIHYFQRTSGLFIDSTLLFLFAQMVFVVNLIIGV